MTSIELRPYQADAGAAALAAHRAGEHPVVSLPTGSGKSLVVGRLAADLCDGDGPIVVSVPSRELAEQNERAVKAFVLAEDVGVVCAALGRRELGRKIIIGTPQSLTGAIDADPACVLVDEAHQMPLHHGSWFSRLFDALPRRRRTPRIGLSATTFRTADGAIYGSPKSWFTCQPYQIGLAELVEQGFLSPVRYVDPRRAVMTTRGVSRSAGDFNQRELVEANASRVEKQAELTLEALADRRKAMVFAVTVDHAKAFRDAFARLGEPAALIVGAMPASERITQVEAFRDGAVRVAVTVSAGLTGFDVPDIDVLACCRPTTSPIIHTQSIGRGTRPFPGKSELLALDFAGNVRMFGPVHEPHFDASGQPRGGVAPWQACERCGTYNPFGEPACFHCGGLMPPTRAVTALDLEFRTIDWQRETRALERRVDEAGARRHPVESVALHAYRKKSDPDSISCMVSLGLGGKAIVRTWFKQLYSPRWDAFWRMLLGNAPAPRSLQEALARRGELIRPAFVDLELENRFWRVTGVDYADEGDEDDICIEDNAELERV